MPYTLIIQDEDEFNELELSTEKFETKKDLKEYVIDYFTNDVNSIFNSICKMVVTSDDRKEEVNILSGLELVITNKDGGRLGHWKKDESRPTIHKESFEALFKDILSKTEPSKREGMLCFCVKEYFFDMTLGDEVMNRHKTIKKFKICDASESGEIFQPYYIKVKFHFPDF